MKIKSVSFSSYKTKLNIYNLEKLDLFAFLFTQIILDPLLNKELKLRECLNNLDIKEDLYYLFNNIYYSFLDNKLLVSEEKEFWDLALKDIVVKEEVIDYLKEGYLPVLKGEEDKDFIYNYLDNKMVLEKDKYNDSNVCVLEVNNSFKNIEKIINDNINSLLNIQKGIAMLKKLVIDPYYFEIKLDKKNDKYYVSDNKEFIYKALKDNSLFINETLLEGEYLSNNIYFHCLYGNRIMKDYCEYLFVYNKEKEGVIEDNLIYVNYEIEDYDFIDLISKEGYRCGINLLEDDSKIATYLKDKVNKVSEFKLYLIKNKNKFDKRIEKIIELL